MIRLVVFTDSSASSPSIPFHPVRSISTRSISRVPALMYHFTVGNLCNRRRLRPSFVSVYCRKMVVLLPTTRADAATVASSCCCCNSASPAQPSQPAKAVMTTIWNIETFDGCHLIGTSTPTTTSTGEEPFQCGWWWVVGHQRG